jgi:hypothetical protein
VLQVPEVTADRVLVYRLSQQDELRSPGKRVEQGVVDELHALLFIQPPNVGDDRAPGFAQPEAVPETLLVLVLPLQLAG